MIWFAYTTRCQRELRTAEALRADGHTIFVPTETVLRKARNHRGRAVERSSICPLVPGYLFAATPTVLHEDIFGVLRVDGEPYPIPHAAMQPLLEAAGRRRHIGEPVQGFWIGQAVGLRGTSFDAQRVTIAAYRDGRYIVTGQLLGRPVDIPVSAEQIAA